MNDTKKEETIPAAAGAAITKPAAKFLTVSDYEKFGKHRAEKARTLAEFFQAPERRARLAKLSQGAISLDQMLEVAMAAISKTPMIAACTLESLALALQDAAELGILPSSTLGLAHLVPYQNRKKAALLRVPELYEAKLIPDYKGLVHLARESGSLLSISAGVIYRPVMVGGREIAQRYTLLEGAEDRLEVHPLPPEHTEKDEDMIYAWAACKIPAPSVACGFVTQWTYLTRAGVLKVKASSRASSNGPWVTSEPEMWKKTAVRRLAKLAPRRGRFGRAVELEDMAEAEPDPTEIRDLERAKRPKGSRAEQLLAGLPAHESAAVDVEPVEGGEAAEASSDWAREPTDAEIEAERAARK